MTDFNRINTTQESTNTNVLQFPKTIPFAPNKLIPKTKVKTPTYDKLILQAEKLDELSKYPCNFDYSIYRDLEIRFKDKPIRGGIYKSNPMKLVNAHHSCQQCLYAFEIDTYGRGCSHNCLYCYAKAELTVHGYWNNPIPVPINLNEIRKVFYTVFETNKKTKWRPIMEKKIPLRVGCMSDSFMWMDSKYKVTQEFLKLVSYYNYPYTVITHSDLVARDDYIALLRKDLCSIQITMSSVNDNLNRLLEPGSPSAKRRLSALTKLSKEGFWTTVRINPIFPIYPDGYFTNPDFSRINDVPKLEYSTFEMVDAIADANCPSIIAGFGRFSSFSLNKMSKVLETDLRKFFDRSKTNKSTRDYHFSEKEIRYYYEEYKRRCNKRNIQFTVCYIGNGEEQFWGTQDLWSNKKDCCNIKDRIPSFKTDTREVPFSDRLKFNNHTCAKPVNQEKLHLPLGEKPTPDFPRLIT